MAQEILHIDESLVDKAVSCWQRGDVVIFPTETVYGVGADAGNEAAIETLYTLKGRPPEKAITVHVANAAMAQRYVEWTAQAEALAAHFWPGPLTLVLRRKAGAGAAALAAGDTLAVRAPAHPWAQQLISAFGAGIAGTSANRSGQPAPVTMAQAQAELGAHIFSIDGGACEVGIASTVLDLTGDAPRILRPGSIALEAVRRVLNR